MQALGNRTEDSIVNFKWSSNAADGSAITRATNGTISVYKADDDVQSTAGVTDTEDFDGLTGIHHVKIDTSADAFYEVGKDYQVVLAGATIDTMTVRAVLASFRIEYGFQEVDVVKWLGAAAATPTVAGVPEVDVTHNAGSAITSSSGRQEVNTTHWAGTAVGSANVLIDGAITANKIATGAIDADSLAADAGAEIADAVWDEALAGHAGAGSAGLALSTATTDVYEADVQCTFNDDSGGADRYTVTWYKNRVPLTSGITSPTLTVVDDANNTIINAGSLTQIGTTGTYKYSATSTERLDAGEAALASSAATIDGSTRTWRGPVERHYTA